jgi:membrane protease YdiL (CAAX protease family)
MSILAAADPEGSALGVAIGVFAGIAAVAVAALSGLLRVPPSALAPRVPAGRPLMPLAGVLFAGVLTWVAVPSLYFQFARGDAGAAPPAVVAPTHPEPAPTTAPGARPLSAREVVAIGAVVPVLAFVVITLGDALVRPVVGQRLGFGTERLGPGAAWGALGIALALPLVYCVMVLTALAFRLAGYEPPGEHELLKTMGETPDPVVKYLAIVVAAVVAPLWEELLFRGHLQTLIREGLLRLRDQAGYAIVPEAGFPVTGVAYDAPLPLAAVVRPPRSSAPQAWAAVAITSLLFAGVHQPWQFPPIFCLSLCLGIAYERTGNLWVPVVMHALFNGVMTAFYLAFGTPN